MQAREEQLQKFYDTYGLKDSKIFELFGRIVHIDGTAINNGFLFDMENRYKPMCEDYKVHFSLHTTLRGVMESFPEEMGNTLAPMIADVIEILNDGGIKISSEQFTEFYIDYSLYGYDGLVEWFNRLVAKKNKTIENAKDAIKYGGEFSLSYNYFNLLTVQDAESIHHDKRVINALMDDVYENMKRIVYQGVPLAVNEYFGHEVFTVQRILNYEEQKQEKKEELMSARTRFSKLSEAEQRGPAGLDLLIQALIKYPYDTAIYRELIFYHAYPGCGLIDVIRYCFAGKAELDRITWTVLANWYKSETVSSRWDAETFLAESRAFFSKMDLTRDDAPPAFILNTWLESFFALDDIINHPLLTRLNGVAFDADGEKLTYNELMEKAVRTFDAVEDEDWVDANKPFRDKFLGIRASLLELIDEDYCTVLGVVYPGRSDAGFVRENIVDTLNYYHHSLDFSNPADMEKFKQDVDNNFFYSEALKPLIKKAARAAELTMEINTFLAEIQGRFYQTRQERAYDVMRGGILEHERKLLEMRRTDLRDWWTTQVGILCNVFGEVYRLTGDADERYFEIMENAWIYQNHLNEKHNPGTGFFEKIGTAMSGMGKKQYEPDYLKATENGTKPLTPILENEEANTASYWKYATNERKRLTREYQEKYDPTATRGMERMNEIKNVMDSLLSSETLGKLISNTANCTFWRK